MGMVEVFSIPDCLHHTVERSRHCAEIIYEQNTHFGYVNHKYLALILFYDNLLKRQVVIKIFLEFQIDLVLCRCNF